MKPVKYVCSYVEKEAQEDDYQEGLVSETSVLTVSESQDIEAPTLGELIQKLGKYYCLDIDTVYFPADADTHTDRFCYNRMEDAEGDTPSEEMEEQWKQGQVKLYLAEFTFFIEKREMVAVKEFATAGVTVDN